MNIIHPATGKKAYTIEDAAAVLREKREIYDAVAAERKAVESRETTARNALNEAQRTFDAAVADVRANAPWNTDWHAQSRRGAVTESPAP